MFAGVVRGIGRLEHRDLLGSDQRLTVDFGRVLASSEAAPGASVAVNGVCLTVAARKRSTFQADVSAETVAKTTLGEISVGAPVNLEPALALRDAVAGHLVTGHVDSVGRVLDRTSAGRAVRVRLQAPQRLARYIAEKGSIVVDGVSLTVNVVDGCEFDVMLIPATLERTIAAGYAPGAAVNLEIDLIARYLDRLSLAAEAGEVDGSRTT